MLYELSSALVLGLIGGIVPGPVLTAIFTDILQSGFVKSLRTILWAMGTETLVALVTLLLLQSAGLPEAFFKGLSIVGAAILLWIATQLWKVRSLDTGEEFHFSLGKISAMILANGVLWTFWITICIPKAIALGQEIAYGQFVFLVLVEIGWFISTAGVALVFSIFRKGLSNPRVVPTMFKLFAIVFAYFAFSMLYGSFAYFFRGDDMMQKFAAVALPGSEGVVIPRQPDMPPQSSYNPSDLPDIRTIATTTVLTRITSRDFSFNLRSGWHGYEERKDEAGYYYLALQYGSHVPALILECPPQGRGMEGVQSLAHKERQLLNNNITYQLSLDTNSADENGPWYMLWLLTTEPDGATNTVCIATSRLDSEVGAELEEMYASWK